MNLDGDDLVQALQDPALYDHPVEGFELVETHISWVLLTGAVAYKLKKPVRFPFLDFSTRALRLAACEDELRLNRRLAPEIYQAVVPITAGRDGIALGGSGVVVDHLLRMKQFDRAATLDRLALAGRLTPDLVDLLAQVVEALHEAAPRLAEGEPWGSAEEVFGWVAENFDTLRLLLEEGPERQRLEGLLQWTEVEHARRTPRIDARKAAGLVRECHGDLHLGNIVLLDGRPTPFDCLEFNPALRWLDPMNDLAFLLMDLHERGLGAMAWRLLSAYLQHGGDYEGLRLLPYYQVYRALVRAKVAALRLDQPRLSRAGRAAAQAELSDHLRLAEGFAHDRRPLLLLTHGLSGSGKSHLAARLVEGLGALQIRSDLERRRLHGLGVTGPSGSGLDGGIYSREASRRTYERLADCAEHALASGHPAVVDATFLARADRERFRALAGRWGARCLILDLAAPRALLERRIQARRAEGRDPSEADLAVLERQIERREPLTQDERARALPVDASREDAADRVLRDLRERWPALSAPAAARLG